MPTPSQQLRQKTIIPSEMRTAEWDALSAQVRERAFFMAAVDDARTLAAFRDAAARIAEGKLTPAEARKELRAVLAAGGYQPDTGLEGGIKDLTTPTRMDVTLRTNAEMAHGWAQREAQLGDVAYPGWALYRARRAKVPRDWDTRWQEAAEAVQWQGVSRDTARKVALVSSPIWAALSRFGQPHPPFDFNSGMDTKPVDFDTCQELGLMTEAALPQMEAARESLNADTEVELPQVQGELLEQLTAELEGIAEWRDGVLRMVDANGTRPYPPDELAQVVLTPNKAGTPLLQAEAAAEWMEDAAVFAPGTPDTDMKQDFSRLCRRMEPTAAEDDGELCRALAFDDEGELAKVLEQLGGGEYAARPGTVAESWSADPAAAEGYAVGHDNIILRVGDYSSARNMGPLAKALGGDAALRAFMGDTRFRVVGGPTRRPNAQGGWDYEYTLAER